MNARLSPTTLSLSSGHVDGSDLVSVRRWISIPGHLAIWVGLYAAASVLVVGLLVDNRWPFRGMVIAGLTAVGTYLIDRAGRSDPADQMAHPDRAALMARFPIAIRGMVVITLGVAVVAAMGLSWLAVVVVIGAPVGVVLYGHRHRGTRLKDRLVVKNSVVAVSMAGMAVALAGDVNQLWITALAGLFVMIHVFADAMLCDLDDRLSDASHGTRTIPTTWGVAATWKIALGLELTAAGVLAWGGIFAAVPWLVVLVLGGLPVLATFILAMRPRSRVKDLVDLTWPLAILFAAFILSI